MLVPTGYHPLQKMPWPRCQQRGLRAGLTAPLPALLCLPASAGLVVLPAFCVVGLGSAEELRRGGDPEAVKQSQLEPSMAGCQG